MAPSDPTAQPTVPTPEALALSASLFTSSIASWIPAGFGISTSTTTPTASQPDLTPAFREERSERLGLGHPLLDEPNRGQGSGYARGGGLVGLSRKLGNDRKGKEKEEALGRDVDDDGEESRAKSIGKGRKKEGGVADLFGGKKKKKSKVEAVHPLAAASASQTSQPSPPLAQSPPKRSSSPDEAGTPPFSPQLQPAVPSTPPPPSSPGGSGIFPFDGPRALDSPEAKRILLQRQARKRGVVESDDDGDDEEVVRGTAASQEKEEGSQGSKSTDGEKGHEGAREKSKTQLRREKRKKAKLEAAKA